MLLNERRPENRFIIAYNNYIVNNGCSTIFGKLRTKSDLVGKSRKAGKTGISEDQNT